MSDWAIQNELAAAFLDDRLNEDDCERMLITYWDIKYLPQTSSINNR